MKAKEDDIEGPEEAVVAKPARDPHAPSQAERDAHEATHLPFRSWCAECVSGRRDNPPHTRRAPEERLVPEVLMDYAFVRRHDETQTMTILIMKDRESRAVRAWTMRNKGVCFEEAAARAVEGIKGFGLTKPSGTYRPWHFSGFSVFGLRCLALGRCSR